MVVPDYIQRHALTIIDSGACKNTMSTILSTKRNPWPYSLSWIQTATSMFSLIRVFLQVSVGEADFGSVSHGCMAPIVGYRDSWVELLSGW